MLRPPPPLHAVHTCDSGGGRPAPEYIGAAAPCDSHRGARATARQSPLPGNPPCDSSLSLYLLRKAAYNLDEADNEEKRDCGDETRTTTPARVCPNPTTAALPVRTPLTRQARQTPSSSSSCRASSPATRGGPSACVPGTVFGGAVPVASSPVPEAVAPQVDLSETAVANDALVRALESCVAPLLEDATQAVLDALVSVEEGDDVPHLLFDAIETQMSMLTHHVCVRAAEEVSAHRQAAVTRPSPGVPQRLSQCDASQPSSHAPAASELSSEEVRQLRDELHAVRMMLGAEPPASSPMQQHIDASLRGKSTSQPARNLPSRADGGGGPVRCALPLPRPTPETAPHGAAPQWVQAPELWSAEEEAIWLAAQRILDENGPHGYDPNTRCAPHRGGSAR